MDSDSRKNGPPVHNRLDHEVEAVERMTYLTNYQLRLSRNPFSVEASHQVPSFLSPDSIINGPNPISRSPNSSPSINGIFNGGLSSMSGSPLSSSPRNSDPRLEQEIWSSIQHSDCLREGLPSPYLSPAMENVLDPHLAPGHYDHSEATQHHVLTVNSDGGPGLYLSPNGDRGILESDPCFPEDRTFVVVAQSDEGNVHSPRSRGGTPLRMGRRISSLRRSTRIEKSSVPTYGSQVDPKQLLEEVSNPESSYEASEASPVRSAPMKQECLECGKKFAKSTKMRDHIAQVHSDERPHRCDKCTSSFKSRRELTRHRDTHSSVTRFRCYVCGHGFGRRRDNCIRHMRAQHSYMGEPFDLQKRYSCSGCQKKYPDMNAFEKHNGENHPYTPYDAIDGLEVYGLETDFEDASTDPEFD